MCGIVGYVGRQEAAPILLDGLERLEYRGYDSAGIAVCGDGVLRLCKKKGRVAALRELTHDGGDLPGTLGIGHTRWATHGEPNDVNAHPHMSQSGKFAVVHNGIIENFITLKEELQQKGYVFQSETDTEVVAQLLDYYYSDCGDFFEAMNRLLHAVDGAYALGIICADYPDRLVAARKDAPLLLGFGDGENFIASDVTALIRHTRDIAYMDDGELAILSRSGIRVYDRQLRPVEKKHHHVDWEVDAAEKGGYAHFMLKEIMEQPAAIRKATVAVEMVPVTCGSSYRNKGVQKLLDAIVDYMPAPTDIPAIVGTNPKTDEEEDRHASDDEPFSALAFKIMTDPYVGRLSFFRVYSGTLNTGSAVLNATKGKRERVGRLLQMHANHREDLETVYSGDIAAVVGLKNTTTGDTLCDEKHPIVLESMEFPEPVIRVAIEPKTKAGQDKMTMALVKLAEEDPTFKTYTDEETGQTIIAGMGELHLEIIVDRLLREFKVEANVGAPQVAYRETIRKEANQETKYARQSGGKGQYGHVKIKIEPNEPGKGYEFVNAIVGGAIPKEYIPAIDNGIQGAMKSGVLAGYPVVDVKVTLWDGSYHEVDSSEMAFSIAGSMAFKDAMRKADPIITEPIMKVAVIVPDEYLGDVIGDLNARRGQIQGMEAMAGTQRVNAFVPLAQMFGYATDLRSKTQGRGQYVMEPSHYEPVPKNIADQIIAGRTKG